MLTPFTRHDCPAMPKNPCSSQFLSSSVVEQLHPNATNLVDLLIHEPTTRSPCLKLRIIESYNILFNDQLLYSVNAVHSKP